MRLLQSVLATLPQTKKPQRKFITHLLGLVLMLPGHATFGNLSRYSSYHERIPDRVRGRFCVWCSSWIPAPSDGRCPGRVSHGQPQTPRLQPTSA